METPVSAPAPAPQQNDVDMEDEQLHKENHGGAVNTPETCADYDGNKADSTASVSAANAGVASPDATINNSSNGDVQQSQQMHTSRQQQQLQYQSPVLQTPQRPARPQQTPFHAPPQAWHTPAQSQPQPTPSPAPVPAAWQTPQPQPHQSAVTTPFHTPAPEFEQRQRDQAQRLFSAQRFQEYRTPVKQSDTEPEDHEMADEEEEECTDDTQTPEHAADEEELAYEGDDAMSNASVDTIDLDPHGDVADRRETMLLSTPEHRRDTMAILDEPRHETMVLSTPDHRRDTMVVPDDRRRETMMIPIHENEDERQQYESQYELCNQNHQDDHRRDTMELPDHSNEYRRETMVLQSHDEYRRETMVLESAEYQAYAERDQHERRVSRAHEERNQFLRAATPQRQTSKLMQPTQAYLLRLQAEQAARERAMMEGQPVPREQRPPRPTRPRSPKLHTSQKAARNLQGDFSRMSSTSRELQLLQEEKMRVEVERLKIWEYHERTKAQRPPTDVHQRSTKQLTIPMSPHLEVGHRDRCFLHHQEDDDGFDCNGDHELPHQHIRPETLVSREFELPTRTHGHHLERTVPESPHLQTAARAAVRNPVPRVQTPEKESPVNHAHSKVGGLTKPISPNLATDRRAQFAATHRKPIEVVDSDEEELAKQFHAKPLNRRILQSKPSSKAGVKSRPSLTKPISPRFATHARSASRQTAAEKAAAERERRERERRARLRSRTPRDQGPPPSHQNVPHHPVVPHTPQLMGLARHKQYQEEFQKRLQEEEMELRRQREFKAKPIRTAAPLKFEGSRRPLTEVIPFQLESERMHERALEKLQQKRLEEEEQLRAAAQFKATPMPAIHDPEFQQKHPTRAFQLKPSSRPLTRCAAPMLASDRRAAERAAFDAAERERRAMEQANKQRMEEEERRREEAKIRRLRREKMVFHARPAPQPKPFELKPTNKALTEPESPFLMTRAQAHRVPSNQAA